jgi:hypothetical protein
VNRARFLLGLASVLAGTTVLLVVLGVVYNPFIIVLAVPFGVGTYMIWGDATGRIQARARRRGRTRESRRARRRTDRRRAGPGEGRRVDGNLGGDPGGGRSRERRSAPTVDTGPTDEEARQVLGVATDADEAEIKSAYRERAKQLHPDRANGDEEAFKRVTEAYERLVEG